MRGAVDVYVERSTSDRITDVRLGEPGGRSGGEFIMDANQREPLSPGDLAGEGIVALPDKEVVSILDLAADIDLAIDGAAPIDLAVALNANVVAPIDAAVSANLLSDGSSAQAMSDQGVPVSQSIEADARATAVQDSTIDQSDTVDGGAPPAEGAGVAPMLVGATETMGDGAAAASSAPVDGSVVVDPSGNIIGTLDTATGNVVGDDGSILGTLNETTGVVVDSAGNLIGTLDGATGNVVNSLGQVVGALNPVTGQVLDGAGNLLGTVGEVVDDVTDGLAGLDTGDLLKGNLLNVDVNVDLDADLAAPINGAVAANANVAAPIDASVAANILSENCEAVAIAEQDAIITQSITGDAESVSDQVSDIDQASQEPVDTDTASTDEPAATQEQVDTGTAPADEAAATQEQVETDTAPVDEAAPTQEPAPEAETAAAADDSTS